jgi:tetrahydromethanopterin S-methyltransferase subunit B
MFEQRDMKINYEIQSAIFLENNETYHSRMKNDVQYHFMRDMVERNKVLQEKVDTLENIVDSLINSMSVVKFSWCRVPMGIISLGL